MHRFITFSLLLLSFVFLYFSAIFGINFLIDYGYTNAESEVITLIESPIPTDSNHNTSVTLKSLLIPASMREIYKYLNEHPEHQSAIEYAYLYLNGTGEATTRFPIDSPALNFVLEGIEKRKTFLEAIKKYANLLNVDPDVVLACVLGEQIRIAHAGPRNTIKEIATWGTPALFRSKNISLGIGGIKVYTATLIKKDAINYGYGSGLQNDKITEYDLANDDDFNAKYAVYLVKNILTRREKADLDISDNPGVICTLYNMGNHPNKEPHKYPKIGGSVIMINDKKYVYGGLSMVMYRYLKIYH